MIYVAEKYRIMIQNAWIFNIPFSDEVSFLLPKSWVLDDSDTHNSSQQETQCGNTFLKEHSYSHGSVYIITIWSQDLFKLVQTCLKSFILVQTSSNWHTFFLEYLNLVKMYGHRTKTIFFNILWRQLFGVLYHNILDSSTYRFSYKYANTCRTINNNYTRKNSRHLMVPCTLVPDCYLFYANI